MTNTPDILAKAIANKSAATKRKVEAVYSTPNICDGVKDMMTAYLMDALPSR